MREREREREREKRGKATWGDMFKTHQGSPCFCRGNRNVLDILKEGVYCKKIKKYVHSFILFLHCSLTYKNIYFKNSLDKVKVACVCLCQHCISLFYSILFNIALSWILTKQLTLWSTHRSVCWPAMRLYCHLWDNRSINTARQTEPAPPCEIHLHLITHSFTNLNLWKTDKDPSHHTLIYKRLENW